MSTSALRRKELPDRGLPVSATRKVFMNRSNGPTKLLKKGAVSMPEVVTSRRQDADVSGK